MVRRLDWVASGIIGRLWIVAGVAGPCSGGDLGFLPGLALLPIVVPNVRRQQQSSDEVEAPPARASTQTHRLTAAPDPACAVQTGATPGRASFGEA
jgi:hypothetical protein